MAIVNRRTLQVISAEPYQMSLWQRPIIELIVILVSTYVVTTLVQSAFGSVPINRLIGFLILTLLGFEWAISKKSHVAYIVAMIFGLIFLHSIAVGASSSQEISEWVYLVSTLLFISVSIPLQSRDDLYRALLKYRRYIVAVVVSSTLLLLILLVTRTGYVTAWGESPYFKGLCNTEHTLASICTLILVFILFLSRTGKSKLLYCISMMVAMTAILETGARTYLIPAAICLILMINEMSTKKWLRMLFYAVVAVAIVAAFSGTGMASKFEFAQGNVWADSMLSALTNGRNEIWATDLCGWASSDLPGVLLGNSFSQIYILNQKALSLYIWAHNDAIMVLYGSGLIGFMLYLSALLACAKAMYRSVTKGEFLLLLLFAGFPLVLNGFYQYQHLVYAFVVLFVIMSCGNRSGEVVG